VPRSRPCETAAERLRFRPWQGHEDAEPVHGAVVFPDANRLANQTDVGQHRLDQLLRPLRELRPSHTLGNTSPISGIQLAVGWLDVRVRKAWRAFLLRTCGAAPLSSLARYSWRFTLRG